MDWAENLCPDPATGRKDAKEPFEIVVEVEGGRACVEVVGDYSVEAFGS